MPNFWNSSKSKQISPTLYLLSERAELSWALDCRLWLLTPNNKPFLAPNYPVQPIFPLFSSDFMSKLSIFQPNFSRTPNNYPGYLPSLSIELAINPFLGGPCLEQQPYPLLPPPINYHLECFTELYAVINPCPSKPNISKTHQNGQTCVKNGLWRPPPAPFSASLLMTSSNMVYWPSSPTNPGPLWTFCWEQKTIWDLIGSVANSVTPGWLRGEERRDFTVNQATGLGDSKDNLFPNSAGTQFGGKNLFIVASD